MTGKYGFGGGLKLPSEQEGKEPKKPQRKSAPPESIRGAVEAGHGLGFVSRDPAPKRKPGPRRTEAQGKISIPGPKRVIDKFRLFCEEKNVTLWEGLEALLKAQEKLSKKIEN